MFQKYATIACLASSALFWGLVVRDFKSKVKVDQTNYPWADAWTNTELAVEEPKPTIVDPKAKVIVCTSYDEALKKSGETGRPVFVVFGATWCGWCKKMDNESLPSKEVQDVLRNYIIVHVDTEKDKVTPAKFSVVGLPSYVITNHKGQNLKFGSGYLSPAALASWLNESKLFSQPKTPIGDASEVKVEEPKVQTPKQQVIPFEKKDNRKDVRRIGR